MQTIVSYQISGILFGETTIIVSPKRKKEKKISGRSIMAWVIRITPYDLSGSMTDFCQKFEKYCAHHEVLTKEGKPCEPHYHIYLETKKCRKSVTNAITEVFSVPKLTRGMANAYYMVKESMAPAIQLGYVQKQGNLICTNFTSEELTAGRNAYAKRLEARVSPEASVAPLAPRERSERTDTRDSIEDQYIAYYNCLKQQVQKLDYEVDAAWVRQRSRVYFNEVGREKGNCGLFPVSSTIRRFQASWLFEYYRKIDQWKEPKCDEALILLGS